MVVIVIKSFLQDRVSDPYPSFTDLDREIKNEYRTVSDLGFFEKIYQFSTVGIIKQRVNYLFYLTIFFPLCRFVSFLRIKSCKQILPTVNLRQKEAACRCVCKLVSIIVFEKILICTLTQSKLCTVIGFSF